MAKNQAQAAPKEEETGLATAAASTSALALATRDELAGVLDAGEALGSDGLEEVDGSDIKLSAKVFNFKGIDKAGDPIPPNVFYDSITETASKDLNLALLTLHKTNEWREYDEAEGRSKIHCRSFDRVNGKMENGTERRCEGCPDAQWKTNDKGKRERRCSPVYNVVAIDRGNGTPCVIRFKKTSLPVLQQHLNKHHLGRRVVNGKPSNYPLFAFAVRASLKMSDDKKYALPVLERGPVLSGEEIRMHSASAQIYREQLMPMLERLSQQDTSEDAPKAADTSFDPDGFVDTSVAVHDAAPESAKRF